MHNIALTQPEAEERERATEAAEASKAPKYFPRDETLVAQMRQFRADNPHVSLGDIAAGCGISTSPLSNYFNEAGNSYPGDSLRVARKVREYLRDQRTLMDSGVETIETPISKSIESALEDIRTSRGIGMIIGAPGIGKSRGIDLYCRSHELAIQFLAWSGECNRASAERLLFEAAGVARLKPGQNKARVLVDKLRGTSRLIIVDDAHKLTRPALQLLFDFRDRTGMPIALFGDERLPDKLSDDAQRLRRCGGVFFLRHKSVKNGALNEAVPDMELIKHHIASILPEDARPETAAVLKLCAQIAVRAGHYGSVQMELSRAVRLHKGNPDWSWCEAIRKAHKRLPRDYELA